jgi:hypothetical protein
MQEILPESLCSSMLQGLLPNHHVPVVECSQVGNTALRSFRLPDRGRVRDDLRGEGQRGQGGALGRARASAARRARKAQGKTNAGTCTAHPQQDKMHV